MWIGPLVIKELKRIVEASEITKYAGFMTGLLDHQSFNLFLREDDSNWPKKDIVGKQELEIRIGNDHIAFEVAIPIRNSVCYSLIGWIERLPKLAPSSTSRTVRTLKASVFSIILFKI